ncbi:MAG: ABC transporter substrate-binding protein [Moraxellaceae bacterium]|nr:ABC transporter substrate-binding protein [Moraxellaceae bacterium]MDZ4386987.1 ABC transporter substrate-binding protein [Moraxellaceae bacterium]
MSKSTQRLPLLKASISAACLVFSVYVSAADARWISTGGAISEWVVALGGEANLVAVDTTSRHPESLTKLPNVGYQRQLSAEGVLALRPDVLLVTDEAGPPPILRQLRQAGVRIEQFDASPNLEQLGQTVLRLGQLMGRQQEAINQWQRYQAAMQVQQQRVARIQSSRKPARVLLLLSHAGGNSMAAGKNTLANWLIEQAGGVNVSAHEGHKAISQELLTALDPDVIIVADRQLRDNKAISSLLAQQPILANLRAVKQQRVMLLETSLLVGGLGPRLPQTLAQLSSQFYPTAMQSASRGANP